MRHDAIGERFGRLTITADAHTRKGKRYVHARCDCGTARVVALGMLRQGEITSCGCFKAERVAAMRHGGSKLIGIRHGEWEVIALSEKRSAKGERYVLARCYCGATREARLRDIRSAESCGCMTRLLRLHDRHVASSAMIGRTVGWLTVTGLAIQADTPMIAMSATCTCGGSVSVTLDGLAAERPSCGCAVLTAMGMSRRSDPRSWLYSTHATMVRRCHDERHVTFRKYGARGISVCDRWRHGEAGKSGFLCFVEDMGEKPTPQHSIGRIDNDRGYEPGNCRWATWHEQAANRRPYGSVCGNRRTPGGCTVPSP